MSASPASGAQPDFLNDCLLEGDPAAQRRARRGKRRAILLSILLQILFVAGLILVPLLTRGENIASRVFVPTVPYPSGGHVRHEADHHRASLNPQICHFCQPPRIPTGIVTHDHTAPQTAVDANDDSDLARFTGDGVGPGVPFSVSTLVPRPPDDHSGAVETGTRRQHVSSGVQEAMLLRRVAPVYPALAVQIRREGRVELHAIIATDGTVQSLEVVSGDPWFIQSALAAVREWRYRPTYLNGQPVEVDTHITVIYTLGH